jgi:hypothetical protein
LSLFAALGFAGTVAAGQIRLATGEIQRTAISRLLFCRISGEHEAEPKDRPRNQFYQHGISLQECRFEYPQTVRADERRSVTTGQQKTRLADEPARRADQQRQTHWRRCVGGPSGNGDNVVIQARLGPAAIVTSRIATGTARVGA